MSRIVKHVREYWLWVAVVAAGVLLFAAFPGDAAGKSRAVLHGLCAQTPDHSFRFGNTLLPFDGRMTGIYGGSIVTFAWLLLTRRVFYYGNPPLRVVMLLAGGVGLMAIDGFNSLFTDLRIWHPYESRNEIRLLTGYLTGMAMAVALCWLLGSSMWRMSKPAPGVRSVRGLLVPAGMFLPYGMVVISGWSFFLLPLTWLLMLSAWLTLTVLMLVVVLLIFRYEDQIRMFHQLHVPAAVASALALIIMLALAGGRYWLEQTLGIPSTL
jgi:uncharacterized membrane protein